MREMGTGLEEDLASSMQQARQREDPFRWVTQEDDLAGIGRAQLKTGLQAQKKLFKFDRPAAASECEVQPEADEDAAILDANGHVYLNPSLDPGYSELVELGVSKTRAYVRTAMHLLKQEKGIDLNAKQQDFLALVTDHIDRVVEFERLSSAACSRRSKCASSLGGRAAPASRR